MAASRRHRSIRASTTVPPVHSRFVFCATSSTRDRRPLRRGAELDHVSYGRCREARRHDRITDWALFTAPRNIAELLDHARRLGAVTVADGMTLVIVEPPWPD